MRATTRQSQNLIELISVGLKSQAVELIAALELTGLDLLLADDELPDLSDLSLVGARLGNEREGAWLYGSDLSRSDLS